MPGPAIETATFVLDERAQQLHQAGLAAELQASFTDARICFAGALDILAEQPQTLDIYVQTARIQRDEGFTFVREALTRQAPLPFSRAETTLGRSARMTGFLLGETRPPDGIDIPAESMSKAQQRELLAEHGATINLLGRLATARQTLSGQDGAFATFRALNSRQRRNWYELAHAFHREGSNGYYRVSNAVTGARAERMGGDLPHLVRWLGRAAAGLGWTAAHDRRNLLRASLTFSSRTLHLATPGTATRSVRVKP
jgi:hypothetical protein